MCIRDSVWVHVHADVHCHMGCLGVLNGLLVTIVRIMAIAGKMLLEVCFWLFLLVGLFSWKIDKIVEVYLVITISWYEGCIITFIVKSSWGWIKIGIGIGITRLRLALSVIFVGLWVETVEVSGFINVLILAVSSIGSCSVCRWRFVEIVCIVGFMS